MTSEPQVRRQLAEVVEIRSPDQRVVVTGIGAVTSIGLSAPSFWESAKAGKSGVKPVTEYDVSDYTTTIAGHVPEFQAPEFVHRKETRRIPRFALMALQAGYEALEDSGLGLELESDRAGALIGSAIGGLDVTQKAVEVMHDKGPMRVSPFFVVMAPANMAAFHLAHRFRLLGYSNSVVTACAAGTQAIGEATEVIRRGDADIMLAGGTEASVSELGLASFCVGKAFSTRNDEPQRASRPFDKNRDGFVGGEGAGVIVLERLAHALERNAKIYAEALGYGASNDAYHLIAPDPTGDGAVRAIRAALARSGVRPSEVDYVNAHATATPLGDVAETNALKTVLGDRAYDVPVSATKSMIGHLFGAAGAVEGIATVKALQEGVISPTINLDDPDPECDLDYVPHVSRKAEIDIALSDSFGLGGQNAVMTFARWSGV